VANNSRLECDDGFAGPERLRDLVTKHEAHVSLALKAATRGAGFGGESGRARGGRGTLDMAQEHVETALRLHQVWSEGGRTAG
jgi:hypothetical protein